MKGIILAGGSGTRLNPITKAVSKQLLPVYNKPMIYYPLSTLIEANVREILVITTPDDQCNFRKLLGDGKDLGINITYAVQPRPNGLAEAFIIGQEFIGGDNVALILGDNLICGGAVDEYLIRATELMEDNGACIFAYPVKDPERYGVVEIKDGKILDIVEKPSHPVSNMAIPGLYFFDNDVVTIAKSLQPSSRGELEITDVHKAYWRNDKLVVCELSRGLAWLDMGTFESLHNASSYIQAMEQRQGIRVGCIYETCYRKGLVSDVSYWPQYITDYIDGKW